MIDEFKKSREKDTEYTVGKNIDSENLIIYV